MNTQDVTVKVLTFLAHWGQGLSFIGKLLNFLHIYIIFLNMVLQYKINLTQVLLVFFYGHLFSFSLVYTAGMGKGWMNSKKCHFCIKLYHTKRSEFHQELSSMSNISVMCSQVIKPCHFFILTQSLYHFFPAPKCHRNSPKAIWTQIIYCACGFLSSQNTF